MLLDSRGIDFIFYTMIELKQYHCLNEKNLVFDCRTINTTDELDQEIAKLNNANYYFRGLREANFKLFSSLQRNNNHLIDLEKLKNCRELREYFQDRDIPITDILLLALLQHYCKPSPLIDFTTNLYIALFFCIDGAEHLVNCSCIENYCSLYFIDINDRNICSLLDIYHDESNFLPPEILSFAEDYAKDNNIPISKALQRIDCQEVHNSLSNFDYASFCKGDPIIAAIPATSSNKETIEEQKYGSYVLFPKCDYHITNPRIETQEGLFIINTSPDKPIEDMLHNMDSTTKTIKCLNIHKSLITYIRDLLAAKGISKKTVYPTDEDSTYLETIISKFTVS